MALTPKERQFLSAIANHLRRALTIKSTATDLIVEVGPERRKLGKRSEHIDTRRPPQKKGKRRGEGRKRKKK